MKILFYKHTVRLVQEQELFEDKIVIEERFKVLLLSCKNGAFIKLLH